MKLSFLICMAALLGPMALRGEEGFSLVSPDHPAAWFNESGQKVSQELSWDEGKQELVLRMAYDTVQYTPDRDQTLYDRFVLTFPEVRRDASTGDLFIVDAHGHKIALGRIEKGFFGSRVVLGDHLTLSAHRVHGVIVAKIISDDSP